MRQHGPTLSTARTALASLAMSAALLGPAAAAAQSGNANELVETYLHTKILDLGVLALMFGVDGSQPLEFGRFLDPGKRTYWYSALPGQTYLGKPLSMNGYGNYDAALGGYRWSTNGSLGDESWTTTGSGTWCCAPAGRARRPGGSDFEAQDDDEKEYSFKGETKNGNETKEYEVKGKAKIGANDKSTTEGTVKSKSSGGPSKFTGTDEHVPGSGQPGWWVQTIEVKDLKLQKFKVQLVASGCESPECPGSGTSSAAFTAVPEPAPLALLATGVFLTGGVHAYRRRTRPAAATR